MIVIVVHKCMAPSHKSNLYMCIDAILPPWPVYVWSFITLSLSCGSFYIMIFHWAFISNWICYGSIWMLWLVYPSLSTYIELFSIYILINQRKYMYISLDSYFKPPPFLYPKEALNDSPVPKQNGRILFC